MATIVDEVLSVLKHERATLRELRDEGHTAVVRNRAALLLALLVERNVSRVSEVLNCARSTIYRTINRVLCVGLSGGLDGRASTPAAFEKWADIVADLPAIVRHSPRDFGWARSTWTVELVALEVRKRFGVRPRRRLMGRLLRKAGCRRILPKLTIRKAPSDRRARIGRLADTLLAVPDDEVILYADEMDLHLKPKVGADWNAPGQRKSLPTPGQNRKRFLAGAWEPETRELIVVDGKSKASDLFIDLCEHLVEVYQHAKRIHLVVDNYVIHKSKKTRKALAALDGKVVLHFLPPYCPEDNAIERVWWDVHASVTRNHTCKSIDELLNNVHRYIADYTEHGPAKAGRTAFEMCRT